MLVTAAVIEIVVLHEHGRRQYDVGHLGGFGHELLVHHHEQVLARETLAHKRLLRRHGHRIGVLDQHRLDRRAVLQRHGVAGQDASNPGLIEHPCGVVARVMALDDGFVELPDREIVEEGAPALVLPGAGHCGDAKRGMHLGRAIAAAGKAIAEAEETSAGSGRPRAQTPQSPRPARPRSPTPIPAYGSPDAPRVRRDNQYSVPDTPGRHTLRETAHA